MFSSRITNSGRFLQMAQSAQALYFHLCMNADDDGVVEASMVLRLTNANEDDFRALIAKEYVRPLNKELVTHVVDWLEHNQIRPDRKIDSIYKALLVSVVPDAKLVEAAPRADTGKKTGVDVQWTSNGPHRLGEYRLGESSKGKEPEGFEEFWAAYPKKKKKPAAIKAWKKEKPPLAEVLASLEKYKKTESWKKEGGQFIPHPASWINDREWEDEVESPRQPIKAAKPLQGFL